jgi:hypothetical protein
MRIESAIPKAFCSCLPEVQEVSEDCQYCKFAGLVGISYDKAIGLFQCKIGCFLNGVGEFFTPKGLLSHFKNYKASHIDGLLHAFGTPWMSKTLYTEIESYLYLEGSSEDEFECRVECLRMGLPTRLLNTKVKTGFHCPGCVYTCIAKISMIRHHRVNGCTSPFGPVSCQPLLRSEEGTPVLCPLPEELHIGEAPDSQPAPAAMTMEMIVNQIESSWTGVSTSSASLPVIPSWVITNKFEEVPRHIGISYSDIRKMGTASQGLELSEKERYLTAFILSIRDTLFDFFEEAYIWVDMYHAPTINLMLKQ